MIATRHHASILALVAGAAASTAFAQAPITVVNGFLLQSWNAGTHAPNIDDWTPERPGSGWNEGIRWNWQARDIDDNLVIPEIQRIFDPSVPGITGAYHFPDARAANINPNGTLRTAWEDQAQPNVAGTFEIWFKTEDLVGTHVIWEIGATGKGLAFALDGGDLVYSVQATDGAGGNATNYVHRQPLADTGWHQAVITIDFFSFQITSYLDGQSVNSASFAPSASYRWTGGNPAGLGTLASDPLFPDAGIANDAVDASSLTDYNGLISTMRFYNVDLFPNEILDNYNALTDDAAAARRGDFNGDDATDDNDAFDYISFMTATDPSAVTPFEFPFPHNPSGGVQTNDPFLDEGYVGDFSWDRDGGFNPTSQEPTFQFPAVNVLEPVPVHEPAFPSIRTAFVMNGVEGFRGPKFEQAEDNTGVNMLVWLYVDDLVGNHCIFEAGGDAVGFSMVTQGDEILGAINTSANDGFDEVEVSSGPGVLQTGWHRFEVVVRRFTGGGVGQGFELYMDGVQIAAINDQPGLDGVFGTADDINNFSPAGTGNTNFIGGNQAGLGQVQGSARLPAAVDPGSYTPFNGMVGPFRLIGTQPLPSDIAANFAADATQNVLNGRGDTNSDGSANFLDVLDELKMIDAGK